MKVCVCVPVCLCVLSVCSTGRVVLFAGFGECFAEGPSNSHTLVIKQGGLVGRSGSF